jgi:hypothetical protein
MPGALNVLKVDAKTVRFSKHPPPGKRRDASGNFVSPTDIAVVARKPSLLKGLMVGLWLEKQGLKGPPALIQCHGVPKVQNSGLKTRRVQMMRAVSQQIELIAGNAIE